MLHMLMQRTSPSNTASPNASSALAWPGLFAAWLISLMATLAALFIGEVMGMMPCVLCWYQRIAMFPLVLILGAALIDPARATSTQRLIVVAAILAFVGWGIASYHTLLYWDWITHAVTPCGAGPSCKQQNLQILGGLDVPMLSWLAFSAILALLLLSMKVSSRE